MIGIHPNNQSPELKDYNLYTTDPVLRAAVARAGAQAHAAELERQGAEYGSAETLRAGVDANRHEPELQILSRTGERLDQVDFHPAWHTMMRIARRNGIANLPFVDRRSTAPTAHGASLFMHCQVESGSTCPTVMTKACIPVLRRNPALFDSLGPLLHSCDYDERDLPAEQKRSINVGMGMTEMQGGSDVRTNTSMAVPAGEGAWGAEYLITGHKWFMSAPMCDAHLVLAKTEGGGSSCFYVPRWRPDGGGKNPILIQRLKDKLGNRSNASSEVVFDQAWGVMVGEEGRGIRTIIEMAASTRADCALQSAGFLRQAFAQALHYTRNRHAFGSALADQPVMMALLADLALESEAATMFTMDLIARFESADPLDAAWLRLMTPVAKFWVCKRAVEWSGEAMEVFGGNGYVEEAPMARLYREAPVHSIWEGSGNVMCLDVLRAISREPDDVHAVLDHLGEIASQEPRLAAQVTTLRKSVMLAPADLEREARRFTQRLALTAQGCLMLRHATAISAAAFIDSRFDPDWGPVAGVCPGTDDPAALVRAAWH